jgi:NADH:ubiquinone oxidoreductase subunit C
MTAHRNAALDPPHYARDTLEHTVVPTLQETFSRYIRELQTMPVDETVLVVSPNGVLEIVRHLVEALGITHLSTITGQEIDEGIELLYHFWHGAGLTLRTLLPLDQLEVATVTDLIPGAAFYEREIAEMLGVTFEGLADPAPMFLPDDWDGPPPLRKERQ